MISGIKNVSLSPSFGFAMLNERGRIAADSFDMKSNNFLNGDLFKRQKPFKESALETELKAGKDFKEICSVYGCSDIGLANAKFIQNQLLTSRSKKIIESLPKEDARRGLLRLYYNNYDNADLSKSDTSKLLNMIKEYIAPEVYIQNVGLINAGTGKK